MRKAQKKQAEQFLSLLEQAHWEIKKYMETGNLPAAMDLLAQCQEGAIQLGELAERTEGEDNKVIPLLENYCEQVYQIHQELALVDSSQASQDDSSQKKSAHKIAAKGRNGTGGINGNNAYKKLRRTLIQVKNGIRNDISLRYEMVFLPYKASMWDSLESVWQAACMDPDCDAYVVPIPYYDKNPDGTLGTYHYEGSSFPPYVPIVHYDAYSIEDRNPDAIYIHTPYDYANYVTSIDPKYYSAELKKHTECLVYIPYYATAGGMSEGQAQCPAYYNVDYIVIQSEKYRQFFDPALPAEKFLPLGSPKFDNVIRKCKNPPEPPMDWKEKMAGKKVYFYNTSIQGMLADTEAFLRKMEYVFGCFRGREDACLLWRPHPLLESTFDSMRPMYKPLYDALRDEFRRENIGIYDDTPDIENTIALSDAYIGDAATSVTALFGVAGKPLFIMNNYIHTLPEKDDWRGERISLQFDGWGDDRYQVTETNQLWFSENNDYHYRFYMDLGTGYAHGGYYMRAVEIKDRIYVLPRNARHMLVIKDKAIRKIHFREGAVQGGAFSGCWYNEKYIFLFPNQYPYLIRFDMEREGIQYVEGIGQFLARNVEGERRIGGTGLYGNQLIFASPVDDQFLFMDIDTLIVERRSSHTKCSLGTQSFVAEGDNLWLLPLNGTILICWNQKTGEVREYGDIPQDFKSMKWPHDYECEERPFGNIAFSKEGGRDDIIISPCWGNMYLTLGRETGRMEEWTPPLPFKSRGQNGYYATGTMGGFVITYPQKDKADCRIWYAPERRLYDVNIDTKEYREVAITFDYEELRAHEPGFLEESEWIQYCLVENTLNSLKDFLDGHVTGNPFDRERQLAAFSRINAETEGICGEKVYRLVCGKIGE